MSEGRAFEVDETLGELFDRVENGEAVIITRHGKPIARVSPLPPEHDRSEARAAGKRLRESRRGVTLGGLSIREMIDEGRRF
jgi:prevent-host-death family protein